MEKVCLHSDLVVSIFRTANVCCLFGFLFTNDPEGGICVFLCSHASHWNVSFNQLWASRGHLAWPLENSVVGWCWLGLGTRSLHRALIEASRSSMDSREGPVMQDRFRDTGQLSKNSSWAINCQDYTSRDRFYNLLTINCRNGLSLKMSPARYGVYT